MESPIVWYPSLASSGRSSNMIAPSHEKHSVDVTKMASTSKNAGSTSNVA